MKAFKIFNTAAAVAIALTGASCASDYLDLEPESTLEYADILTNAEGATLAINGLCGSMYRQYSALYDYNWFNGEPWLSMYYGDVMGVDYISLFWFRGYPELVNWTQMDQGGQGSQVAWSYCYGLISQANNLISFTPKLKDAAGNVLYNENDNPIPDIEGEYAFRYAQALTMRAHAYIRLMQIYGPRWEWRWKTDGVNERGTVPLRLEYVDPEGNMDCPLSTMSEVMKQIYADLDQALELYDSSGWGRSYQWEPDKQVAQGIYARAALLKNDYVTAEKMAHEARQGYDIMSYTDYRAGFAIPTSEWMWTNSGEAMGVYFASFGATYACNGAYPTRWGNIGAGAINYDLIRALSPYDSRMWLYFTPMLVNSGDLKRYFYQEDGCDSNTLDINFSSSALHDVFVQFCAERYDQVNQPHWYAPYTIPGYYPSDGATSVTAQFGAQFKFWGTDGYSTSYFPFMRASEMVLIEAEAAYQNMKNGVAGAKSEAEIREILNELVSKRYLNGMKETATGDKLLQQIKIHRRIELWGEGFSWFDFKRWEEPFERQAWESTVQTSGNWPASVAGPYELTKAHGWRWRIPSTEYNYNHAIDQSEVTGNDY